jgi:hypothetical protein
VGFSFGKVVIAKSGIVSSFHMKGFGTSGFGWICPFNDYGTVFDMRGAMVCFGRMCNPISELSRQVTTDQKTSETWFLSRILLVTGMARSILPA